MQLVRRGEAWLLSFKGAVGSCSPSFIGHIQNFSHLGIVDLKTQGRRPSCRGRPGAPAQATPAPLASAHWQVRPAACLGEGPAFSSESASLSLPPGVLWGPAHPSSPAQSLGSSGRPCISSSTVEDPFPHKASVSLIFRSWAHFSLRGFKALLSLLFYFLICNSRQFQLLFFFMPPGFTGRYFCIMDLSLLLRHPSTVNGSSDATSFVTAK